jgi:hypothetical protein
VTEDDSVIKARTNKNFSKAVSMNSSIQNNPVNETGDNLNDMSEFMHPNIGNNWITSELKGKMHESIKTNITLMGKKVIPVKTKECLEVNGKYFFSIFSI